MKFSYRVTHVDLAESAVACGVLPLQERDTLNTTLPIHKPPPEADKCQPCDHHVSCQTSHYMLKPYHIRHTMLEPRTIEILKLAACHC